ncbi:hypothetical protein NE237_003799 [Protea cynaroides]|uniref:R13L1/DRL21-like LRR repeat region domain-containing protein n=1 Tax=Protea cynaroides TaxID=273540 RepID=A0A9Q0KHS3_9MAGN|nr:hypothetical protein NE237_003799 [Protea cynaroides]
MRALVNLRQLIVSRQDGCLSKMPIEMGRLIHLEYLSTFVVGDKSRRSIKELQCLELGRTINIFNLEKVRSKEEANEANLKGKGKLSMLHLSWGSHVSSDDTSYMLEDDVLEGLQPHPNLKQLRINNFGGKNFPRWMMSGCGSNLPNLVNLYLHNCKILEGAPLLGQLPSLKIFHLTEMKRMKSFGSRLYYNDGNHGSIQYDQQVAANAITTTSSCSSSLTTLFPSLEELSLGQMPSLEEWVEPQPQDSCPSFPRLEKILVKDCPKLMIIPSQFPSLKHLHIERSNGTLLRFVVEVPSLTKLHINEVPDLQFLPEGLLHNNITDLVIKKIPNFEAIITPTEEDVQVQVQVQVLPLSLESLEVSDFPSMTSPPDLRGLHCIRKLYFAHNEKITRLPEGLHTLRTLELICLGCFSSELESFPNLESLHHLPSLRILLIIGWSKLSSLPEEIQSLTQLQELGIFDYHSMVALPDIFRNFSSLQMLHINGCAKLKYFPKEEELQGITALQWLFIDGCPLLSKRCAKGRGEEWPKIKHIQGIKLDGQYLFPYPSRSRFSGWGQNQQKQLRGSPS